MEHAAGPLRDRCNDVVGAVGFERVRGGERRHQTIEHVGPRLSGAGAPPIQVVDGDEPRLVVAIFHPPVMTAGTHGEIRHGGRRDVPTALEGRDEVGLGESRRL